MAAVDSRGRLEMSRVVSGTVGSVGSVVGSVTGMVVAVGMVVGRVVSSGVIPQAARLSTMETQRIAARYRFIG